MNDWNPYYKYSLKNLVQREGIKLYWNQSFIANRTFPHKRPDVGIDDKEKKAEMVNIAIQNDGNTNSVFAEKNRKYKAMVSDLKDLLRLGKVDVKAIVVSSNGLVPMSTVQVT